MNARQLTRWAGTQHPDNEITAVLAEGEGIRLLSGDHGTYAVEVPGTAATALDEIEEKRQKGNARHGIF